MMALFILISALTIILSLGVVIFSSPIYSALSLVGSMLMIAAMFAMLEAHFLSIAQIIVYAGAVMVLFVFVIMLLNLKVENPRRRGFLFGVFAWGGGIVFSVVLAKVFMAAFRGIPDAPLLERMAHPPVSGSVKEVGKLLYTEYLFPFEAASLLIIAAILGAVMLAKKGRSNEPQSGRSKLHPHPHGGQ